MWLLQQRESNIWTRGEKISTEILWSEKCQNPKAGVCWRNRKFLFSVATAFLRGKECDRKGFQRDGWGWVMQSLLLHRGKWKTFERLRTEE